MDIRNMEFKRSFKGYNEEEVDAFLAKIVGKYESLIQENKALNDQIKELEAELRQHQNKESDIHGLIALTRETVNEAKEVASQHGQALIDEATIKAKVIVDEANLEAKKMLEENLAELGRLQSRIRDMAKHEADFKEKMRVLMETFWAMLEDVTTSEPEVAATDEFATTRVYSDLTASSDES